MDCLATQKSESLEIEKWKQRRKKEEDSQGREKIKKKPSLIIANY